MSVGIPHLSGDCSDREGWPKSTRSDAVSGPSTGNPQIGRQQWAVAGTGNQQRTRSPTRHCDVLHGVCRMDLGDLMREQAVQQVSRATSHPSLGRRIATDADRAGHTCPGQRRTRPTRGRRWCAVSTAPAGVPTPAGRPVPAWLLRSQQGSRSPELAEPAESVPGAPPGDGRSRWRRRPALGRAQPRRHATAAADHLASTARSTTDATPPSAASTPSNPELVPCLSLVTYSRS